MYIFLVLLQMILILKDVKKAIINVLDLFKAKGLTRDTRENVIMASEELLGVLKKLNSIGGVTNKYVCDVLQGLSSCNNSRFKENFALLARNVELGNVCILQTIKNMTCQSNKLRKYWPRVRATMIDCTSPDSGILQRKKEV